MTSIVKPNLNNEIHTYIHTYNGVTNLVCPSYEKINVYFVYNNWVAFFVIHSVFSDGKFSDDISGISDKFGQNFGHFSTNISNHKNEV